jgi:ketosteroid isomerase-like protein
MMTDVETTIRQYEDERSRALVEADYAALADLVSDDLVHIHATGAVEGKKAYIEGLEAKLEFLSVVRPGLDVRVYGNIAVATGPLDQSVRVKGPGVTVDMKAIVTQVWRLDGGRWRICSFQATNIA